MSDTWHVFYRTMGMANRNEKGWSRGDFLADSPEDALAQLMKQKHNILHVRVYPGASAFVAGIDWTPEVKVRHEPHSLGEGTDT